MSANRTKTISSAVAVAAAIVSLAAASGAQAVPVKLLPSARLAHELRYPASVAVAASGDVYVADRAHHRIQELTPAGEFVLMFGQDVNKKGGDLCTKAEESECQAGVEATGPGAFKEPFSVAVAPGTGNVYVVDHGAQRVDEYTPAGEFLLMFGKEVNKKGGDLCTKAEAGECQSGVEGTEHGAFSFIGFAGNLLAFDSAPEHLLYVGDEHRVQEFNAAGEWKGEIPLGAISSEPNSKVTALTVDASGDMYLAYSIHGAPTAVVHEFTPAGAPSGEEVKDAHFPHTVTATQAEHLVGIAALALDPTGHLAVSVTELPVDDHGPATQGGLLLDAATGRLITQFPVAAGGSDGLAFDAAGDLFAAIGSETGEVQVYEPMNVGEVLATSAVCGPGVDVGSSATFSCSLDGEANPFDVSGTEVWAQLGTSCSGLVRETVKTALVTAEAVVAVSNPVQGLLPNHVGWCYRLAGSDQNVKPPELLTSETVQFDTPVVPPRVVGEPQTEFVGSSSAVLFGELNPENAPSEYFFEYAQQLGNYCEGAQRTGSQESTIYGSLATTLEARGLQPATTYHTRLCAINPAGAAHDEHGGSDIPEGTFTTLPAPVPTAVTGPPSAVGATSAVASGTVNPDGQTATYTFELGVYEGPETQYGVVFSAPAGASSTPVPESLELTGLQPGSTYAYRIQVASGYGSATGQPVVFATLGLPAVLSVPVPLAQLAVPSIVFPTQLVLPSTKPALKKAKKKSKKKKRRKVQGRKSAVVAPGKGKSDKQKPSRGGK
jgi:hypothetical protein